MSLITRNRKSDTGSPDVTFAAQPVDMSVPGDATMLRDVSTMSKRLNQRAWKWYEAIGEIHYAVGRTARTAGYGDLGVYVRRADGTPGKKITGPNTLEAAIAKKFISPVGGQRGLIERFFIHMKVPGDTWLIRIPNSDGSTRGYDFVSSSEWSKASLDELGVEGSTKPLQRITLPGSGGGASGARYADVARADVLGRVWRPAGQYVEMPDSPLYALDDTCEVLHLLTRGLKKRLNQRVMMNGVWYIPSEINEARSSAPKGKPGELHNNKVIDEILRMQHFAAMNPDVPSSDEPVILAGPGDQAQNLIFTAPDREIFQVEMDLRAELIDRVLFGLDINPQGVKGTSDANHWGAWAASDDEQRVNVKPDIETLCWALTVLVLNREMMAADVPPGRIESRMVWYDLSRATAKTNAAEDVRQVYDRGEAGPAVLRRGAGIDESDAATGPEKIRMVGWKMGVPELALYGVPEAKDIDFTKIVSTKPGPNPDSTAPDSKVGPGKGDPGSPNDNKTDTPKGQRPG